MTTLSLEVVTPHGVVLAEDGVSTVVLRRFESRFTSGSQIVFMPHHGSETVHLGEGVLEYQVPPAGPVRLSVAGGFAQIDRDRVTVLTPEAHRL